MRQLYAFVVLALIACGSVTDPYSGHTWRESALEIAAAQCSRWIECGTDTTENWTVCVQHLIWDFCGELNERGMSCEDEYPGNFEIVSRCAAWYVGIPCGEWVEPCAL